MARKNVIDRKFEFVAVNPANGHHYSHENALVMCAKDAAVPAALAAYYHECQRVGASLEHVMSVKLLLQRVIKFQRENGKRVPDTTGQAELDRCLRGIGV